MDTGDDHLLFNAAPDMNDLTQQGNLLPSFEDAPYMTYYINESDAGCTSILPTNPQQQVSANGQVNMHSSHLNQMAASHSGMHHQSHGRHFSSQMAPTSSLQLQTSRSLQPNSSQLQPSPQHSFNQAPRGTNPPNLIQHMPHHQLHQPDHVSLLNGYLNNPSNSDPLPQFSQLQESRANSNLHNSLFSPPNMLCLNPNSNELLYDSSLNNELVQQISTDIHHHGHKELINNVSRPINDMMPTSPMPKSLNEVNNNAAISRMQKQSFNNKVMSQVQPQQHLPPQHQPQHTQLRQPQQQHQQQAQHSPQQHQQQSPQQQLSQQPQQHSHQSQPQQQSPHLRQHSSFRSSNGQSQINSASITQQPQQPQQQQQPQVHNHLKQAQGTPSRQINPPLQRLPPVNTHAPPVQSVANVQRNGCQPMQINQPALNHGQHMNYSPSVRSLALPGPVNVAPNVSASSCQNVLFTNSSVLQQTSRVNRLNGDPMNSLDSSSAANFFSSASFISPPDSHSPFAVDLLPSSSSMLTKEPYPITSAPGEIFASPPKNPSPEDCKPPAALTAFSQTLQAETKASPQSASPNAEIDKKPVIKQETPSILQTDQPKMEEGSNINNGQPARKLATIRTVVICQVLEQVVVDGNIMKETVLKNDTFTHNSGFRSWPEDKTINVGMFNSTVMSTSATSLVDPPSTLPTPVSDRPSETNSTNGDVSAKNSPASSTTEIGSPVSSMKDTQVASPVPPPPDKSKNVEGLKKTLQNNGESSGTRMVKNPKVKSNKNKQESLSSSASKRDNLPVASTAKRAYVDTDDFHFRPIEKHSRVLAKWSDKNFYPGRVFGRATDNKWLVQFDDGGRRAMGENEIICIDHLPVGQSVMVTFDSGFCVKGQIVTHRLVQETDELFYTIDLVVNGQTCQSEYCSSDVFLNCENALVVLGKRKVPANASKFADVDLNNIIPKRARVANKTIQEDGKVSKSSLQQINDFDMDSNGSSSTQSVGSAAKGKKKAKSKTSFIQPRSVASDSTDFCSVSKDESGDFEAASNLAEKDLVSEPVADKQDSQIDEKFVIPAVSECELHLPVTQFEHKEMVENLKIDCITTLESSKPEFNANLFEGWCMVILQDSTPFGEITASQDFSSSIRFDAAILAKLIDSGGGKALTSFDNMMPDSVSKKALLSNTCSRSLDYLRALASGITCVSHLWIYDCIKNNRILVWDDFILPTGYSYLENRQIKDSSIFNRNGDLFRGSRILLSSKNAKFFDTWRPLLLAANVTLADTLPSQSGSSTRKASNCVDLVISDHTCSFSLAKRANSLKVPIVSIEYFVQCLIHGQRLDVEGHEQFTYNYKEK